MRVRPTKDQAASFENFHKISSDMAKLLIAWCAAHPGDPMARLDDANDQLTAINYAATTVQIAFDDFYAKLDGAQNRALNLGPRRHMPKGTAALLAAFNCGSARAPTAERIFVAVVPQIEHAGKSGGREPLFVPKSIRGLRLRQVPHAALTAG